MIELDVMETKQNRADVALCMNAGSLPYLAPEVLQMGGLTKAADVYSYAILLLELWSGEAAYQDQNYHGVSIRPTNTQCNRTLLFFCDKFRPNRPPSRLRGMAKATYRTCFLGVLVKAAH